MEELCVRPLDMCICHPNMNMNIIYLPGEGGGINFYDNSWGGKCPKVQEVPRNCYRGKVILSSVQGECSHSCKCIIVYFDNLYIYIYIGVLM